MIAALALVFFLTAFLGCMATRAAYRNGFWDGVQWERELPPTTPVPPPPPGMESPYPSKPGPGWHGWSKLL